MSECMKTLYLIKLCQVSIRDRNNYTCAVLGKTTWTLEQTKPYVFTVKFSGGSDGR